MKVVAHPWVPEGALSKNLNEFTRCPILGSIYIHLSSNIYIYIYVYSLLLCSHLGGCKHHFGRCTGVVTDVSFVAVVQYVLHTAGVSVNDRPPIIIQYYWIDLQYIRSFCVYLLSFILSC